MDGGYYLLGLSVRVEASLFQVGLSAPWLCVCAGGSLFQLGGAVWLHDFLVGKRASLGPSTCPSSPIPLHLLFCLPEGHRVEHGLSVGRDVGPGFCGRPDGGAVAHASHAARHRRRRGGRATSPVIGS